MCSGCYEYSEAELEQMKQEHEANIESCSCFYGGGCFYTTFVLLL